MQTAVPSTTFFMEASPEGQAFEAQVNWSIFSNRD
jgi:hypothetical protein